MKLSEVPKFAGPLVVGQYVVGLLQIGGQWRLRLCDPQGVAGETGPAGPEGPAGPQGPEGPPGTSNARWYFGTGTPNSGYGADGDAYLRGDTGDYYVRSGGLWGSPVGNLLGPEGPQGQQGQPGTSNARWLFGSGSPASADGSDGDAYLDSANGDYYQKAGGSWGAPRGNLRGQQGQPGTSNAVWYFGTGSPSGGVGIDGDAYLANDTGDYYQKVGGSWGTPRGNLRGPAGTNGASAGPPELEIVGVSNGYGYLAVGMRFKCNWWRQGYVLHNCVNDVIIAPVWQNPPFWTIVTASLGHNWPGEVTVSPATWVPPAGTYGSGSDVIVLGLA